MLLKSRISSSKAGLLPLRPAIPRSRELAGNQRRGQKARINERAFKYLVTNPLDGQLFLSLGHDPVLGTAGGGLHASAPHRRQSRLPIAGSIPRSLLPFGQSLRSVRQQRHSCQEHKTMSCRGKKGCNPSASRALSPSGGSQSLFTAAVRWGGQVAQGLEPPLPRQSLGGKKKN